MLYRSALALASFVSDDELSRGHIYPRIQQIRKVSEAIAYEGTTSSTFLFGYILTCKKQYVKWH